MSEKVEIAVVIMSKAEAEDADKQIIAGFQQFTESVGPALLRMREQKGYEALGFKSFPEYAQSVQTRIGGEAKVYYLIQHAEVEKNLEHVLGEKVSIPIRHARELAKLKEPETQAEAYQAAVKSVSAGKLTEKVIQKAVEKIQKSSGGGGGVKPLKKGWSAAEVKEDEQLSKALDRISEEWGEPDRGAIQRGTVDLKRTEVLAIGALPLKELRAVRELIMGNRWSLQASLDFLNDEPDRESTVEDLQDWCLANNGTFKANVDGFKVTIEATKAVLRK